MYKIMIVEDDLSLAETLESHLEKWNYQAFCVRDFKNVHRQFVNDQPHLVILDINLPYYDGYYWCSEIRKQSNAPILFLSSISDNMNMVMAINMGGDDFVMKPCDMNLLTLKIRALLRRSYTYTEALDAIEQGGVVLNLANATVSYEGNTSELTRNEHEILKLLFASAGRVVSRETLISRLWQQESFIDDNTLTVNMTRLRKKIDATGIRHFIKTKKGKGYYIG